MLLRFLCRLFPDYTGVVTGTRGLECENEIMEENLSNRQFGERELLFPRLYGR